MFLTVSKPNGQLIALLTLRDDSLEIIKQLQQRYGALTIEKKKEFLCSGQSSS